MNALMDRMLEEAVEAGQKEVLGPDYADHNVVNLICDILELEPVISDSERRFLGWAYEQGTKDPTGDVDEIMRRIRDTSSYKFLRGL